jgi:adenine-specific DNA-methyltransferase
MRKRSEASQLQLIGAAVPRSTHPAMRAVPPPTTRTASNGATATSSTECEYRLLQQDSETAVDNLASQGSRFQLVYLDPPYNTGRLRGARRGFRDTKSDWQERFQRVAKASYAVLNSSGFLAVSINQMELFSLKGMLDEIFGAECFVGIFPVKIRHKDRQLMINATFHDLFEYLLIYRKTKQTRFFTTHKSARQDKFIYTIDVSPSRAEVREINGKRVEIYKPGQYEIQETGYTPDALRKYTIAGKLATANWSGEWYENHLRKMDDNLLVRVWGLEKEGLGYRWFQTASARRTSGLYYQSQITAGRPILPTNDLDYTEIVPTIFKQGGPGCDYKDSKKPEELLTFLMEVCTQAGDMVLDPYAGSGTTLAVAIKLGRSAVLIENNDAAIAILKTRIKNMREGRDIDGIRYSVPVLRWS